LFILLVLFFFFFSSRRRHTRFSRDWSSDVCSSDLEQGIGVDVTKLKNTYYEQVKAILDEATIVIPDNPYFQKGGKHGVHTEHLRSEERRVGKECRSRWSPYHEKKK